MCSDSEWIEEPDTEEILRRVEEIRSGKAEMIPGEEVMRELEEDIAKMKPSPGVSSTRPRPEDFETDAEYEAAWDQEIERRLQAYDRGEIEAVDAKIVIANLRRRLGISDGPMDPQP